jgi:DNA-binding NarL/FixJ family response regulator
VGDQLHSATQIRAIVSAAHPTVRNALREFLSSVAGTAVVGEAAVDEETMRLVEHAHPDVAVLDWNDAFGGASRDVREIKRRSPSTRVVVVALDPAAEPAAMASGADVFLMKGCPLSQLAEAVR